MELSEELHEQVWEERIEDRGGGGGERRNSSRATKVEEAVPYTKVQQE